MRRLALPFVLLPLAFMLPGCKQGYSPNTYAATAAQQEAAVQRGVIIGVRQVMITSSGTIGAAAGGAAGGVAGSQISGGVVATGLGAVGGALVGGIGGTAAAQAVSSTKGWEYIVQETGDKLVSVTQTSKLPLPVGQNVLVISDSQQARIVPDYTVQLPPAAKPAPAPAGATATEIYLSPLLPPANTAQPLQVAPLDMSSPPPATPAPAVSAPAAPPAGSTTNSSTQTGSPAATPLPAAPKNATPAPQPTPAAPP